MAIHCFLKDILPIRILLFGSVEQSDVDSSFFILANKDSASCIINIDKVGEILWQKNYQLQNSLLNFRKMKLVGNDSIFILGRIGYGYDGDFFLKMDHQGKYYSSSQIWTGFTSYIK
ncbi:MAG: hypothetical protein IPF75_10150 [Bacteroidetes bacterium]|nr:hypothetical protein [Bacteroidota bacterium]